MFKASVLPKIDIYIKLISDGNLKTHVLLLEQQPYGSTLVAALLSISTCNSTVEGENVQHH